MTSLSAPTYSDPRQDLDSLHTVGIVVFVQPLGGPDQRLGYGKRGVRIFFGELLVQAENLFRIILPDLVVGYHRYADALEHRLLVPRLPDTVAVDRTRLEC